MKSDVDIQNHDFNLYINSILSNDVISIDLKELIEKILEIYNISTYVNEITSEYNENSYLDFLEYDTNSSKMILNMYAVNCLANSFDTSKYKDDNLLYKRCFIDVYYKILCDIYKLILNDFSCDYEDFEIIKSIDEEYKKAAIVHFFQDISIDYNDTEIIYKFVTDKEEPSSRIIKNYAFFDTINLFEKINYEKEFLDEFIINNSSSVLTDYKFDKADSISYPLYEYFSENKDFKFLRYLRKFEWFSKKNIRSIIQARNTHNLEHRLIYGMPIDLYEYIHLKNKLRCKK